MKYNFWKKKKKKKKKLSIVFNTTHLLKHAWKNSAIENAFIYVEISNYCVLQFFFFFFVYCFFSKINKLAQIFGHAERKISLQFEWKIK